jgi:hypothetical protein
MRLDAVLERARRDLRGGSSSSASRGVRVLARADGADPAAFLATWERPDESLVFPLRAGRNLVGRRQGTTELYRPAPGPPVLEQCQWFIECGTRDALVTDAASTNLSVLVRGPVDSLNLEEAVGLASVGFLGMDTLPGAEVLPHPNTLLPRNRSPSDVDAAMLRHGRRLREGDVLRVPIRPTASPVLARSAVDGRTASWLRAGYVTDAWPVHSRSRAAFHAAGVRAGMSRAIAIPRDSRGRTSARYSVGLMPSRWHVDRIEYAIAARCAPVWEPARGSSASPLQADDADAPRSRCRSATVRRRGIASGPSDGSGGSPSRGRAESSVAPRVDTSCTRR